MVPLDRRWLSGCRAAPLIFIFAITIYSVHENYVLPLSCDTTQRELRHTTHATHGGVCSVPLHPSQTTVVFACFTSLTPARICARLPPARVCWSIYPWWILMLLCEQIVANYAKCVPVSFHIDAAICPYVVTDGEWVWQMVSGRARAGGEGGGTLLICLLGFLLKLKLKFVD